MKKSTFTMYNGNTIKNSVMLQILYLLGGFTVVMLKILYLHPPSCQSKIYNMTVHMHDLILNGSRSTDVNTEYHQQQQTI